MIRLIATSTPLTRWSSWLPRTGLADSPINYAVGRRRAANIHYALERSFATRVSLDLWTDLEHRVSQRDRIIGTKHLGCLRETQPRPRPRRPRRRPRRQRRQRQRRRLGRGRGYAEHHAYWYELYRSRVDVRTRFVIDAGARVSGALASSVRCTTD